MADITQYVNKFKVQTPSGTPTEVGVEALKIDSSLITSSIGTTGTDKLITDTAFISWLTKTLVTSITSSSTDAQIPSAKSVWTAIADSKHLKISVVAKLPTENIDTDTIYLVPKSDTEKADDNIYNEYVYVNNKWELIGTTAVDLTNYVKNTDFANSSKGGVIKSSSTAGEISVNSSTGIASVNGWSSKVDAEDGKSLIDTTKITKLDNIAENATKTAVADKKETIDGTETVVGKTITITASSGTPESVDVLYGYRKITLKYKKDTESSYTTTTTNAGSNVKDQTIGFEQGDNVTLEPLTDKEGNPWIKISAVAGETPDAKLNEKGKVALPYYDSTHSSIDLTGATHNQ